MNKSDTIIKISPAYLAAQKEIEAAVKGSTNPFFHSNYADLNSVMDACKKALNDHEISVLQPVMGEVVETILLHSSGEWLSSETKVINARPNDPQAQGSAITYARRYGLQSMVFIGAEDDDGESSKPQAAKPTQSQPVKPAETVFVERRVTTSEVCRKCGAEMVHNPKTGKDFCKDKCWLKPVAMPQAKAPMTEADEALTRMVEDEIPF